MKKYSRVLSLVLAFAMLISLTTFADDIGYEDALKNTAKSYEEYIDKAIEAIEADGGAPLKEPASILLWIDPTYFKDGKLSLSYVFVTLQDSDTEDTYCYSFSSDGKPAGGTGNFDFGGKLADLYSDKTSQAIAEAGTHSPDEITNMILGGRVQMLAYYVEADDERYVILYHRFDESLYNEMNAEEYELEFGKAYTEEEFVKILEAEAEAYSQYLKEKRDRDKASKDYSAVDDDGNVVEHKAEKDNDRLKNDKDDDRYDKDDDKDDKDDMGDICSCPDCPDAECKFDDDDCDCDLAECSSDDCREDAAKRERKKKKADKIKEYGVFKGDPDGSLREADSITRAEFAAVICRILGIDADDIDDVDEFDDVGDWHWAKGYINAARKAGIIEGKGSNRFDPEGKISNEEAIKMIVAAMGYAPKAEQLGGYPHGYVSTANQLGVTTDLTVENAAEAVRGDIIEMIYNSLDIPMMLQSAFGENAEYVIADGTNGDEKTIRIILEIKVTQ